MSQQQQSYPTFVEQIFALIEQKGRTREEVETEFKEIYNHPVVGPDIQFASVEAHQRYTIAVLWQRYVARQPVKERQVIPCGFDGLRLTRSKKLMSSLYVIVQKNDGKPQLRRISLLGTAAIATMYRNVNILSENGAYRYTVMLGVYSDGGDFSADERAEFSKPTKIRLTPEQFRKMLNIPLLKINQLVSNPSEIRSDGYTVNTDWRCVRGVIAYEKRGLRKGSEEIEWGQYKIVDETTPPTPHVTSDGRTISPALTCWTPPELMTFERESMCEFYGTVGVDKDGIPSLSVKLIIPVYAKTKVEVPA